MRNNHAMSRYYESAVNTSSPERLVVMLYDGAIRAISQSMTHIDRKNMSGKRDSVDRALAIIQQLQTTLDMEKGSHIAAELDRLYTYTTSRILEGSAKMDTRPLEEAVRLLTTLKAAWEQVASPATRSDSVTGPKNFNPQAV